MDKPVSPKDRIIVALDVPTYAQAATLVSQLEGHVGAIKIGLQFVIAVGVPAAVGLVKNAGMPVMLDLKLHDIPDTMAAAACAAQDHYVDLLTVHASAGIKAMRAVSAAMREADGKRIRQGKRSHIPRTLAVTALTSMTDPESQLLYHRGCEDVVHDFSHDAAAAGMDGIVCSPSELDRIRGWSRTKNLLLVTPGVRPTWAAPNDQKRFTTPFDAIRHGADYLVIGRPIIAPPASIGSSVAAVRCIAEEIHAGLSER